jgi:hypothetical protein
MEITKFVSLLTNTAPAPSDVDIQGFEASIGCILPADYRKFLFHANGGFVPSGDFPNRVAFRRSRLAAVANVFGLREEAHLSLVWHVENLGVPLPSDLIGIMDDGNGNLICLAVSGKACGAVYIRDGGDIYLLTKGFSDFIAGLKFWEELFPIASPRVPGPE